MIHARAHIHTHTYIYVRSRVSDKEWGGGDLGSRVEIPLQPLLRLLCPCRDPPASLEEPPLEQVDTPQKGCDPVGSPCWSRLLAGLCRIVKRRAHEEQDCWQEW